MELFLAAIVGATLATCLWWGLRRPMAEPAAPAPQSELQPLLESYQEQLSRLEQHQSEQLAGLNTQLALLRESETRLHDKTTRLGDALSNNQLRGSWGEMQLKRTVELAGMTANVDFATQVTLEGGRLRPDLVVHLPGGGHIVVDAKAPLGSYLKPLEAWVLPENRGHALIGDFKRHVNTLGGKEYWQALPGATEFVVMFIPNEAVLGAAVTADPGLMEYAAQRRVVLASPATLLAILFAVAQGWRQETASKNVARIAELGLEIYQRLQAMSVQFDNIQSALDEASTALKNTRWHLQSRVYVSGKKLQELTGADKKLVERDE